MPSIGQTWVLASIGAVVEMGILSIETSTTPSFDETAGICAIPAVVDTCRVLRARETTARGVYSISCVFKEHSWHDFPFVHTMSSMYVAYMYTCHLDYTKCTFRKPGTGPQPIVHSSWNLFLPCITVVPHSHHYLVLKCIVCQCESLDSFDWPWVHQHHRYKSYTTINQKDWNFLWLVFHQLNWHTLTQCSPHLMSYEGQIYRFLARLRRAMSMTWRPPSSSVSKARFNETWCEDTFGQYAKNFFWFSWFDLFCGLQASILKIRLLQFKSQQL
jgi:hypothetical protein